MTGRRRALVEAIWGGQEPFALPPTAPTDFQGWNYDNPFLARAVAEARPGIVVEIGVWKGSSAIAMAERMEELGLDGVLIAVDTWLGAWDHWINPEWRPSLGLVGGYPSLYRTFEANIHARGLTGKVLPLPLDSGNAAEVLRHHGVAIDVLHIDGAHDHAGVTRDLSQWWPLLRPGGILLGDDYYTDGAWPDVFRAFNDFFETPLLENDGGKCWVRKPH